MKNPLISLNAEGFTYEGMARKTGLHVNTIYNIARMSQEDIGELKVSTATIIKEKLGADLWKYFTTKEN